MNDSSQAFTHFVINRIDPEVRNSLTSSQLQGIKEALTANSPFNRHPVDIRSVLPVFFARFYIVLLIGRDRRNPTKRQELQRRKDSDILVNVVFYLFLISPILLLLLIALYLTKTELGIDIFPNMHLMDWLNS